MLVVFDVDGTLTRSTALDARLYAAAFADVFGAPLPSTDWTHYTHATDRGIATEAATRLGIPDADPRLPAFAHRFVTLLVDALAREPVAPVPGAGAILSRLLADGHRLALATGCFAASARAKLASAGLAATLDGAPLVGCDAHLTRESIVAAATHHAAPHERVVSVGDAPWDARTAARLALPFVPIDPNAGYPAPAHFLATLTTARPPDRQDDAAPPGPHSRSQAGE